MSVIDFYEAVTEKRRNESPCPDAFDWVQSQGHDPEVFLGGKGKPVSTLNREEFQRFKQLLDQLPNLGGQFDTQDAVSWASFDIGPGEDMVAVYDEMLGIDRFEFPRVFEVSATGRRVVLVTTDMDSGGVA